MGAVASAVKSVAKAAVEVVGDVAKGDIKGALKGIGDAVDTYIVKPISSDPITFMATAAAAMWGIPAFGLQAGGVAAGIANTAAGLAQGEKFDQAVKEGVLAGATVGATQALMGGPTPGTESGGVEVGGPMTGGGESLVETSLPSLDATSTAGGTGGLDPSIGGATTSTTGATAGSYTGGIGDTVTDVQFGDPGTVDAGQFNTPYAQNTVNTSPTSTTPTAPTNTSPTVNAPTNASVYNPAAELKTSSAPILDPRGTLVPGTETGVPVYDVSTSGSLPMGPEPTALQTAGNVVKMAGEYAWDNPIKTALALDYATDGGLIGVFKDRPEEGPGGTQGTPEQIGDSRFYEPLELLDMKRNQNLYANDMLKYGQGSGEHKFLTDPVYVPTQYAEGGSVDPAAYSQPLEGQLSPQDMQQLQQVQQQPAQGQPMGALSQMQPAQGQPARPGMQPPQGRPGQPPQRQGALQMVKPSQQNPNYRYFSYGKIPPSVVPNGGQAARPQGALGYARGGGVSDGRTDDVPAVLSEGEYVMDAETVALLGNGSNEAGAKRLDQMRQAVRMQKGGHLAKGEISPDALSPLAYLSRRG